MYSIIMQTAVKFMFIRYRQGENWHHQRQPMSKFTMVPRKVGEYHTGFNAITQDLLKNVLQLRDPETKVFSDLPKLLFKWSFECKYISSSLIPLQVIPL